MISEQKLLKLHIEKLKNIKDLEIDFDDSNLIAIVGENGSGKSSILHALACCYKPVDDKGENYKFSQFFIPNTDALWAGSKLSINHTYRSTKKLMENATMIFKKDNTRWTPKYERRVERHVVYIGISSCVPKIEEEKRTSRIEYRITELDDEESKKIRKKAGYIMNREYSSYSKNQAKTFNCIGVKYNDQRYSSLSMSAGEQRIFKILRAVYDAPKYSMILIDELDLLLHVSSFKKLIEVLDEKSQKNKLQVIFTTHSPYIFDYKNVSIKYIYNTVDKTFCNTINSIDIMYELTGLLDKPLEIFVEDDFAKLLVEYIASKIGVKKYVSVIKYGAAVNCFSVAAGLKLSNKLTDNMLFVLDGDKYRTDYEKEERIKKNLTGTTEKDNLMRSELKKYIYQFNLPEGYAPEHYVHKLLIGCNPENELVKIAKTIHNVNNDHKYISTITEIEGGSKDVTISNIFEIISYEQKEEWDKYTLGISKWLNNKKRLLYE
ncbi:ATP-dependent nuclease [Clostridium ihumii]|uniref:ATP-dependent nuclease n=1 Tax=Clostridium ihumii TaxID=1470356 RepID=UPI003D340973